MSGPPPSIFERQVHPLKQAFMLAFSALVILTIIKFTKGDATDVSTLYWEVSASCILFYAMMNSIMSMGYDDQNFYWMYSMLGFALLLISTLGLSFLYSGVTIDEAGSFRWMILVFTFGYLILLTIVRSMRKIIEIAQREDSRLRGEE